MELRLRYATPYVRCRHWWYECDGGINLHFSSTLWILLLVDRRRKSIIPTLLFLRHKGHPTTLPVVFKGLYKYNYVGPAYCRAEITPATSRAAPW